FTRYFILVYDIPDPRQPSITPWYYISYNPSPFFMNDILFQTEIVFTLLKILNEPFKSGLQSEWESFFNNTAPATGVYAVGLQANRQVDALRVVLLFDTYTDIYNFLKKHQWPGDFDDMQKQTKDIVEGCDLFRLTI